MQEKITKTLALMRHGEAEEASPDYTRKLTWKGEEQVYSVAEQLQQKHLTFDLILASAASRTTQTASIIHNILNKNLNCLSHLTCTIFPSVPAKKCWNSSYRYSININSWSQSRIF